MTILLVIISLELALVIYFLYYSLILPQIENKRKIWAKFEQNLKDLEKPL